MDCWSTGARTEGRRADDLTPTEKRQRLDSLTVERNQLLKDAVLAAKAAQQQK